MLDIFTQAIDLLTRPPGDLVYHLIGLFALEALLGFAIVRARRVGWTALLRQLAITGAVVLVGRVALMIVALLSLQGLPPDVALATVLTPPLERAIDLLSLGFLAWAFVPLLRDRAQLGLGLLIINSIAVAIAYTVLAGPWAAQAAQVVYAATAQETVWQVWSLAIASLAIVSSAIGPRPRSGVAVAAFIFLAGGHALQLISPLAGSHIAAWVRLAQLAAYPMLAVVAYQLTTTGETQIEAAPLTPAAPPEFNPADPIWQASAAIHTLTPTADVPLALQQVAAKLAEALQAEVAAIGLRDPGSDAIELSAIHHPGAAPSLGARLTVSQQPIFQRAFERGRPVIVSKSEAALELAEVFGLLGSFVTGPLLAAPLIDDGQPVGIMLAGNPTSGREWNTLDVQHAGLLSAQLATALAVTRRSQQLAARADDLERAVRKIETEATQRRLALEMALRATQIEAQNASTRLASLAKLQEEIAAQRGTDDARWQQQLRDMADERARLESARRDQQAEVARLTALQNKLEAQALEARQQLAARVDQPIDRRAPSTAELDHQREVLTSIVQELRTPMTSITGYTDLLLGESVGILGAMQRQFLQRVKANIERMDGMLGDLIGVTAIDTGRLKIEPEPVEVAQVIEETVLAAAGLLRDRELAVRIELADPLPRLHADRDSLHQIIQHLLSNAALCSPSNSEIVVRAQAPAEMADGTGAPALLLFSVTDRGGGIAPEDRRRAFNRMYRADHPLVQGLGETGVGLSISKALVEAQGGRIWVDSEMGVGSTFTFVLPLNTHLMEPAA